MKTFRIENIKSFTDSTEIEIKPITIFVGKNSCGKSSLVRFPVVLSQTFQSDVSTPLLLFGNMIDYGNFEDVLYKYRGEYISFDFSYGIELYSQARRIYPLRRPEELWKSKNTVLKLKLAKPSKKIVVEQVCLNCEGVDICTLTRLEGMQYKIKISNIPAVEYAIESQTEIQFNRFIPYIEVENVIAQHLVGMDMPLEKRHVLEEHYLSGAYRRIYTETNEESKNKELDDLIYCINGINAYFLGINNLLRNDAQGLTYIGPFRENPKRTYRDIENNYGNVGVRGENTGMLLRQAYQDNGDLLQNVSEWFQKSMGYQIDIKDLGNSQFSVGVKNEQTEFDNLIDVGYGISQVLPIVTELNNRVTNTEYFSNYGKLWADKKLFIVEQPELHLHPAAQAQLADLFANHAVQKRGNLIIETHSEHMIRKLQVLIADPECELCNDQVNIYYVDKNSDGVSTVRKMNITETGQFEEEWPDGFFDKSYELSMELLKANSKRRKE